MTLESTIRAAHAYLDPLHVDCVVYHSPCIDGSSAAMSAWVARGDEITYIPRDYTKQFDFEQVRNKNIILIDCSFKPDELHLAHSIAKKVVILDHHYTAYENLKSEPGCFFSMDHSGAMLGWRYFHGFATEVPRFIRLVEDRDLWRWSEREASEPLAAALIEAHPKSEFKEYLKYLDVNELDKAITHGKAILLRVQDWCAEKAQQARLCTFKVPGTDTNYVALCVELDGRALFSELGEYLYTRHEVDLVMLWCPIVTGGYKISFRNNNLNVNVADIAALMGGGGHARAAGASWEHSPWSLLEPISTKND